MTQNGTESQVTTRNGIAVGDVVIYNGGFGQRPYTVTGIELGGMRVRLVDSLGKPFPIAVGCYDCRPAKPAATVEPTPAPVAVARPRARRTVTCTRRTPVGTTTYADVEASIGTVFGGGMHRYQVDSVTPCDSNCEDCVAHIHTTVINHPQRFRSVYSVRSDGSRHRPAPARRPRRKLTPVVKRTSTTLYVGSPGVAYRGECWSAVSKDGVWRYDREEESGRPWYVRHIPTGRVITRTWGRLNDARHATANGEALRLLPPSRLPEEGNAMNATDMIKVPVFQSREAGFDPAFSVQITQAVWDDCVAWGGIDTQNTGIPQDEEGRLWDVLYMTRRAMRAFDTTTKVQLHRWTRDTPPPADDDEDPEPPLVELLAVRSLVSDQPVVTIMQPSEHDDPHADCGGHAYQQVTCDRCKRTYQCTPTDDYYCAAEGDHACEPCLLVGIAPDGVIVVDTRD